MAKIYLAASYARRREMQSYAAVLETFGHQVICRWIAGSHSLDDGLISVGAFEAQVTWACEDYDDARQSDWIISFTEPPRSKYSRGGRHVEFGVGLATGKRMIVIGYRENLFHYLPHVEFYSDWDAFVLSLLSQGDDKPGSQR